MHAAVRPLSGLDAAMHAAVRPLSGLDAAMHGAWQHEVMGHPVGPIATDQSLIFRSALKGPEPCCQSPHQSPPTQARRASKRFPAANVSSCNSRRVEFNSRRLPAQGYSSQPCAFSASSARVQFPAAGSPSSTRLTCKERLHEAGIGSIESRPHLRSLLGAGRRAVGILIGAVLPRPAFHVASAGRGVEDDELTSWDQPAELHALGGGGAPCREHQQVLPAPVLALPAVHCR
jgi:hypothetical protein